MDVGTDKSEILKARILQVEQVLREFDGKLHLLAGTSGADVFQVVQNLAAVQVADGLERLPDATLRALAEIIHERANMPAAGEERGDV